MEPTWRATIQSLCRQAQEAGISFMMENVEVCVLKHSPDWDWPTGYYTVHRVSDGAHCGDGDANRTEALDDARMALAREEKLSLPVL